MHTVTSNESINYAPRNLIDDVLRSVHMLLRVYKMEQPLMRDFAMDSDLIDKKIDIVENRITSDLLVLLKKYEPRAILKQVRLEYQQSNDFNIILSIEVIV